MNEFDVAMVIIFLIGLAGLLLGSCSPHPVMMFGIGLAYICTRITVRIVVTTGIAKKGEKEWCSGNCSEEL